MAVIKIPGGSATLRDKLVAERHYRILEAAYISAGPALQKLQQETPEDDKPQSEEERVANMITKGEHLTMSESMSLLELQDAAIVAFLERWSLSQPLPTLDTVGDIDRETYKVLSEATKGLVIAALGISTPSFEPTPVQVDEASGELFPTGVSNDLDGP